MGPITKQLRVCPFLSSIHIRPLTHAPQTFIWSDAPVHYKISMSSYMFSYYGIAASTILSIVNYLILGFALNVDGFYMHSFEIWLACMVVFPGAGNIGYTILEYRLGNRSLLAALIENSTWVPFLCVPLSLFAYHATVTDMVFFSHPPQLLLLRRPVHPPHDGAASTYVQLQYDMAGDEKGAFRICLFCPPCLANADRYLSCH